MHKKIKHIINFIACSTADTLFLFQIFVEYISMMDFRPYLTYLNDTPEIRIYHELRPAIQQDRLEVRGHSG